MADLFWAIETLCRSGSVDKRPARIHHGKGLRADRDIMAVHECESDVDVRARSVAVAASAARQPDQRQSDSDKPLT